MIFAIIVEILVFAVVLAVLYRIASGNAQDEILEYLESNPGWHFGLDIVKGAGVSRSNIYFYLGRLEELGLVQRLDALRGMPTYGRSQYRAKPSPAFVGPATVVIIRPDGTRVVVGTATDFEVEV